MINAKRKEKKTVVGNLVNKKAKQEQAYYDSIKKAPMLAGARDPPVKPALSIFEEGGIPAKDKHLKQLLLSQL